LFNLLRPRIIENEVGDSFIKMIINGESVKLVVVESVPLQHQPANIMGLPMFFLMGLHFKQQQSSPFLFGADIVAHDVVSHCLEKI